MVAPLLIVTRPSVAGQRLFDRLGGRGFHVVWWPAFAIGPAPDVGAARAALSRLADYDLAIFVSANAVRGAAPILNGAWPPATAIGAVGAATRVAVETELRPDSSVIVIAPEADDESGSEAFWDTWQTSGREAQRVLVLRAEGGREWLAQRFTQSGTRVDAVAVYSRRTHCLSADDLTRMKDCVDAGVAPTVIFSSSEAVAALDAQVGESAKAWLRTGTAISTHARIGIQLRVAGYARVIDTVVDDDSIVATLESTAL